MSPKEHPYRPEIDGLRMIAVVAVVLYHFGMPGLSSGFAGVDVFFVISGYLIGGMLWRETRATGRISLAWFYIRRVKRLAPAFFAMALAASVTAWFVLLPFEFREFGKSLIAATVYLSNVLFFRGAGYFDTAAESKVLLHTWSLSVEEQFYIFLPLALLLLARWPRVFIGTLWLCFTVSLAASVWFTPSHQTATFYLFPFRTWELLAGVLLAIWSYGRAPFRAGAWISWLGLGLVIASLIFIDAARGFPGWQVIFPVLGTMLLLVNGQARNMVNGVLSMRGPVFFGKISYSLYLWHWPVFVLSYYWRGSYAGWWEALAWICVSLALAWLSWRYVETPFRRMEPRGWAVLGALALPSATALGFGALAYVKDGLPTRFDLKTQSHIQASGDFLQDFSRCYVPSNGAFEGVELCPIGPEGAPQVLIWGDSHVRAFKEGLEQAAWDAATPALIIWHAGCAPLFGVTKTESYATPAQDAACTRDKAVIARDIATLETVRDVLLVGRWSYYASGRGVGLDAENTITLEGYGKSDNAAVLRAGLAASLPILQAQFGRVHVLEQMPELPHYDSREAARLLAHGRASEDDIAARSTVMRAKAEARYAQAREAMGAAPVIKMWDAVCTSETCSALQGTESWYFDNNHITNTAAEAMAARFSPFFEGRLSNE